MAAPVDSDDDEIAGADEPPLLFAFDPAAQKARLEALLVAFVHRYRDSSKQRTAAWYTAIKTTVGGSELAAVMGWNPYRKFLEVVQEKAGTVAGFDGGNIACWWGSMFEDVMTRFIALDVGSPVIGDEICVQEIRGHRHSPDGYTVVGAFWCDGQWNLWSTDCAFPADVHYSVVIEIKCPYRRMPDGKIPRYYRPQVWSGLVVSPVCHHGLFVDGVFRRCSLAQLGPSGAYDDVYHRDRAPLGVPVAWGLTGVYAPRTDAPLDVRIKGATAATADSEDELGVAAAGRSRDASAEAWRTHSAYFGLLMRQGGGAPAGASRSAAERDRRIAADVNASERDVIDFGDATYVLFDRTMGLLADKLFLSVHVDPCFHDGRGADLQTAAAIGRAVDRLRARPPAAHHYLLGVIPWKLFDVNYTVEPRRAGFRGELIGHVDSVHDMVADARASGNAREYLEAKVAAGRKPRTRSAAKVAAENADAQGLFDLL